ncbi:MAG: right-handed parallel beta-helix repeat-containing protein [Candidatus Bathyarchaeota archaeon]|nr:right-handed parallel beta-helix repeat-containing protein [Candidatus Bathyarchaeum sp.]
MNKSGFSFFPVLLITILVAYLTFVCTANFGVVRASTEFTGMIATDTTWTKANSPYVLTGNVFVNKILTIEPGVTVNLGDYELLVNQTLRAQGTDTEKIHFNGGQIQFYGFGSWNETTGSGCIIENAILESTRILPSGCKINNNYVNSQVAIVGTSIISNNTITEDLHITSGGRSLVSNNVINNGVDVRKPCTLSNNTIGGESRVVVGTRDVVFSFNTIGTIIDNGNVTTFVNNTISKIDVWGSPVITGNLITGTILVNFGLPIIANNSITGTTGIDLRDSYLRETDPIITGNTISGCTVAGINVEAKATIKNNLFVNNAIGIRLSGGMAIIEKNLITNNSYGIDGGGRSTIIRYNIITQNEVGLDSAGTIIYNNIINNTQYNVVSDEPHGDVNATYNWWGTTDTQAINQTIYDYKYTFNTGHVGFTPFLIEPHPETLSILTHDFSSNPVIPEFPSWIILPLFLIATILIIVSKIKLTKIS